MGETGEARADDMAVVWVAQTMVEAQIAEAALDEAGIPCVREDFSLNPYDGVWVIQKGWGRILVRRADLARGREIIEQALEARPLRDEEGQEPPENSSSQ